ncbi:non-specific lipid-transfer protein-like protein At5g64080 [Vigna unguiculata]|uniref:non-specific lipid-transfer protein-like protein At5g64080 n=1 Tax=Vigna unguiculata TaxID=3917 RepID=UPI001015DC48|nr:non-specific lipid-transfer protein-like protein At5g64080 [Vigna unguiculata]
MAPKWFLIAFVAVICSADVAPTVSSSHHGHAHAPAPSADCSALVLTLADCLPFVSDDGGQTKPQGKCCSSLKTVLATAPNCLCDSFKNSAQLGIAINVTKALTLPAACKLSTPSLSNCGLSPSPAPAPGSSSSTSAAANGGAPSSTPGNAASARIPISVGSFIVCLFVVVSLIPF